ncbi:uncharacterized protein LOC133792131 [Humulus lupulus]|uniref:uncharacterized protein LOC133792131 n=1 Tax=Humulus lupulus TaxID=3486 RepID=UPI002B411A04|nr:uncharacterized protein LOC133792131 [Humulus lupulus]
MQGNLWGIFFDLEEDCQLVLRRRPRIVSNQLLNIREWPEDGDWQNVDMDKVVFWVQAHGLSTPYLNWENAPTIANKIGDYLDTDRASRLEAFRRGYLKIKVNIVVSHHLPAWFFLKIAIGRKEWIQFKHNKLPMVCYNCGRIAHDFKNCMQPKAFVYSLIGKVVPMNGPWIKSEVPM